MKKLIRKSKLLTRDYRIDVYKPLGKSPVDYITITHTKTGDVVILSENEVLEYMDTYATISRYERNHNLYLKRVNDLCKVFFNK